MKSHAETVIQAVTTGVRGPFRTKQSDLFDQVSELARLRGRKIAARHGAYQSKEALLLAEGTYYVGSKKWFPRCGWRRGCAKQCYRNSCLLTHRDLGRYLYCEGYGLTRDGHALEHAWVENHDGLVIDPTWRDGVEYLGLRFPFKFLCATLAANQFYGLLPNIDVVRSLLTNSDYRAKHLL